MTKPQRLSKFNAELTTTTFVVMDGERTRAFSNLDNAILSAEKHDGILWQLVRETGDWVQLEYSAEQVKQARKRTKKSKTPTKPGDFLFTCHRCGHAEVRNWLWDVPDSVPYCGKCGAPPKGDGSDISQNVL